MAVFGMTIPIDADASKFNKEMRKMDRSIRTTQGEIRDLSKSLKIEWDSKRFVEAQKKAQQALNQTEVKAKTLRERLKYLEETGTDKSSEQYRKLESQLTRTEAKAVEMKAKLQEINNLKFDKLKADIDKVGEGFTKAGQALTPVSAAATALIAGFAKIGQSAINAGDDIGTTAQQLNISTKALQQWRYIAQQTDVDLATLTTGLTKVQVALGDLSLDKTNDQVRALETIGITSEQAAKGMSANFENIILSLSNLEDSTMQAALANDLFGKRMGAQIIPLLNDGGDGIQRLTEEFEAFGYVSDDDVQKLDAFEDVIDKIKYQFELIKNEIGVVLLPVMENLATFVQDSIVPAFDRLKERLASFSEEQIQTGLKALAFVAALAPLLLMVGKLTKGVGSIISIIPKLHEALTFLAAHPIVLVIVGIIALLVNLYNKNEEFRNSVQDLGASISSSLKPIMDALIKTFKTMIQALKPIFDVLIKVINIVMKILVPVIKFLVELISKVLVGALNFLRNAFVGVFNFIAKVVNGIVKLAEGALNGVIDFINSIIRQVNKLGDVLGFTIKELDNVAFNAEVLKEIQVTKEDQTSQPESSTISPGVSEDAITGQITNFDVDSSPDTVINNDYSDKDVTIEVTVNNFGEEIDVDKLVNEINIKLAAQM